MSWRLLIATVVVGGRAALGRSGEAEDGPDGRTPDDREERQRVGAARARQEQDPDHQDGGRQPQRAGDPGRQATLVHLGDCEAAKHLTDRCGRHRRRRRSDGSPL